MDQHCAHQLNPCLLHIQPDSRGSISSALSAWRLMYSFIRGNKVKSLNGALERHRREADEG